MTGIVRTDGVLGGDPRIAGTRVGVLHVYELAVSGAHDPADVADQLELPLEAVYAALAYFYENPEEMREVRRANDEAEAELAERSISPPSHS